MDAIKICFLLLLFYTKHLNAQSYQIIADSLVSHLPIVEKPVEKINLLNEIAYTYRRISGDSTLKYARLAHQAAAKYNYIAGQSIAHKNIGIGHYKLNAPKDSMVFHYKKAIQFAEQINDYYTQAACNNNIALLFSYYEDPYRAIQHYLQGIEIFDQHIQEEKMLKALMLANVAQFYFSIDNFDKALFYIQRAFDIAKRRDFPIILTNYADEYGRILLNQGKFDLAEKVLKEGLKLSQKLADQRAIIGNLNGLAELFLNQNKCQQGKAYAMAVADLSGKKGFFLYRANNLLCRAKVASCEENYDQVIIIAKQLLSEGDDFKLTIYQQSVRKLLAEAYEKEGAYQLALQVFIEYDSINNFITKTKKTAAAAELETQYSFEKKQEAIFHLEKEKALANSYINQLWLVLIVLLLSIIYIIFLLKKRKASSDIIQEKNQQLSRYIASNLQLENFAYIASHDLRAPILTIKNFVSLVLHSANERLNIEETQSLQFAASSSDDILKLVDGLMNFSTLQEGKIEKEKIFLPEFVNYVLDLNKPLIDAANANVEVDIQTTYIKADRTKLLQLIQNLIQNALKFHKKNTIPKIRIEGISNTKNHLISIRDNGIGIAPNYFERIFLLFKRLHNKSIYKGTGIGLALCKKVVEMHNGKIWVESTEGEGATFYCSFPK